MKDRKKYGIAKFNFCPNCGSKYPYGYIDKRELPCDRCEKTHYINRNSVAALIVPDNTYTTLWLCKRADNGLWCLPCGFSEPGETIRQNHDRELTEEINIKVSDPETNIRVVDVLTGTRKVNDVVFGIANPTKIIIQNFIQNDEVLDRTVIGKGYDHQIAFPHHKNVIDRYFAGEFSWLYF